MSVKKLLLSGGLIATIGLAITAVLLYVVNIKNESLYESQVNRYESYLLADELRQSSDDLTRLARTYVLTGDDLYEEMYWDILAIRNGEKARPQHMERVYWDLVLKSGDKPRADGIKAPLNELMKSVGITDIEFEKLAQAQKNSDGLVTTETIAMNAVKGLYDDGKGNYTRQDTPDLVMASRIMHDSQYHQDKALIMKPINEFLTLLDERTSQEVMVNKAAVVFYERLLMISMLLTFVAIMISSYFTYKSIMKQIGGEPSDVLYEMNQIEQGNLAKSDEKASKFGIAAGLISMSESLRITIEKVKETSSKVAKEAADISVVSSQVNKGSVQQSNDINQVVGAMNEMVVAISEVANSSEDTLQSVVAVDNQIKIGNTVIDEATNSARQLSSEINLIANVVGELTVETEKISSVLGVIGEIAEQTNLLALNAAIEAARAGEQGRGFAVVADEVRTLASRTQHSTSEIEDIISSLQQGAERAKNAMDQGIDRASITLSSIEKAGDNFTNIAESVVEINQKSTRIATTANQQKVAAHTVNENLENINQVAHETVRVSEKTTSASDYLSQLAKTLQSTVDKFDT
ncbi:MAG: methyl-accepting chemotaxis protein [Marinomonas sp.]|uniref:methyl-accepting chemotaxis protein n=1 Tax=Marinomonas sp. GJ51-6 TaxID=2992802 RepID=UPI00293478E4|nr:methyl-accepting chemotaxis protein [Marinomonas sp. GJ51-6]WOD07218.1 methyl-accepting chemotaxis protein [Marinomonas sp. GJ51-6]